MFEVMARLQQAELVDDEEDFLIITDKYLEPSMEENRLNCFGKILAAREPNIPNIRRCLRRAWRGQDFRVCKLGTCLFQFFFQK